MENEVNNMYKTNRLKDLCKQAQINRTNAGVTQKAVAYELGYSVENISAFENGRNNNAEILNYYVNKGWWGNND